MALFSKPKPEETMAKDVATHHIKAASQEAAAEDKALALVHQAEVDEAALFEGMKKDQGKGLSKDAADNIVPLIYLLQPLSPQVIRQKPEYIPGAEPGDIWLRNADPPIVKADKGVLFQPCFHYRDIVEWKPDRGGFVQRHDISCLAVKGVKGWTGSLTDVKEVPDEDDPNAWPRFIRASTNNEVVEHRYFVGWVYPDIGGPMPFIIPLSSTGHLFGRSWMFQMNAQVYPDGTPDAPNWMYLYRLKSTMKTNAKGSWFMYTFQKERRVSLRDAVVSNNVVKSYGSEYERGEALHGSFLRQELKAEAPIDQDRAGGGGPRQAGSFSNDEDPM